MFSTRAALRSSGLTSTARTRVRLASLAVALFLGATATGQDSRGLQVEPAPAVSIQLQNGAFKVVGWKAPAVAPARGWVSLFAVYSGTGDVPPVNGKYSIEGDSLVFRPQFPLAAGAKYRAVFQTPGGKPVQMTFDGPPRETVSVTRVERVYPTADILPSNDLKLYVYFSAPMSRGEAWERIHLLGADGKKLPGIFLELDKELWDANNQRLTVWFDPGRIKRGLTSNLNLGPSIEDGKRYTLVIDREWKDARGVPLVAGFKKVFRGGPSDRTAPDPKQWRVTAPKAGTSQPLIVDFPESMDYIGLQKALSVSDARAAVAGTIAIDRQETRWSFTPREAWQAGNYRLLADGAALEDLAANKMGLLFDMDVVDKASENVAIKSASVAFTIR